MQKFYRTTFLRENFFGLDSIQGYLEMAQWYKEGSVNFVCNKEDVTKYGTMLFTLNQLEKDENINIEWEDYQTFDDKDALKLKQISLTIKGHKLLDELNQKSMWGNLKKRSIDLFWVFLTTIFTTLIVLKIKGI